LQSTASEGGDEVAIADFALLHGIQGNDLSQIAIRIMGNLARVMSQRMRETNEILRQL
jgi:hypothetical protein